MHRAYTLVERGCGDLAKEKGIGGWVFASEATAKAGALYLPECAPPTEVRPVELAATLRECARPDREVPGLWRLTAKGKILSKTSKAKPKKAKRRSKKKTTTTVRDTLFDLDAP